MGIAFQTSLDLDLLYARYSGFITFDDFRVNFERYLGDVHYRPGRPEFIDLSQVTGTDLNFSLVRSMLHQVNAQMPDMVVSTHTVVWAPTDTVYGIGRMYQSLAEQAGGIRVEMYLDEAQSLAALGLPQRTVADLLAQNVFHPPQARNAP